MSTIALTDAPPAPPVTTRPGSRALAAAVAVQPVLLGINAVFHPDVDISGAGLLAGASEGPTRWYLVHLVAALGALLGVPAAFGIRRLVGRNRPLARIAVAAGVFGSVLLAMSFVAEGSVLRLVAGTGIDDASALQLADAYARTAEFYAVLPGLLCSTAAALLFGVALLRQGCLPRWQPKAYLVGIAVSTMAMPGTPVGPAAFALVSVVSVGIARRVATT